MSELPSLRPRSGLTKDQTRLSLRQFTWYDSFRNIFLTICGPITLVFVSFARSLGISSERMGLLAAAAGIACIVPLLVMPLTRAVKDRKRFILGVAAAEPLLLGAAALLIPALPAAARLPVLMAAVFAAAVAFHLARSYTDEWMASVIPASIRGRYLGRKLRVWTVAVILTVLAVGPLVELVEAMGEGKTTGLAGLLIVGGLFGFLSVIGLGRAAMPAASATSAVSWRSLVSVVRPGRFTRSVLCMTIFNLPFAFACPYYHVYYRDVLGMPPQRIAMMYACYLLVRLATAPMLGRLADRIGPTRMGLLTGPIYAAFFAVYIFGAEGRYVPFMLAWAAVAIADAGAMLSFSSLVYGTVPRSPSRPAYFAAWNIMTWGSYAVGGAVATPVLESIRNVSVTIGPLRLGHFHLLYVACTVLMLITTFAALWFPKMRERGHGPGD